MSREKFQNVNIIFDRLKAEIHIEKDVELAKMLGITPSKLGVWRARNFIPLEILITLCREKDIDIHWLLTGEGIIKREKAFEVYAQAPSSMIEEGELTYITNYGTMAFSDICHRFNKSTFETQEWIENQLRQRRELKQLVSVSEEAAPHGDFIYIPMVSGKISAGGGLIPETAVELKLAFKRDWIQKHGDPRNMSLIRVSGDSMEPTLNSGDIVLVDHNRNYIDPQGGIYAIAMDDIIMIKRLQVIYPSKKVRIISDNVKYEPLEAESEQIIINGKVIWFGREIER